MVERRRLHVATAAVDEAAAATRRRPLPRTSTFDNSAFLYDAREVSHAR